jgi:GrpB-like predicted nucleotidyltransferase (UPF0157 family)
MLGLKRGTVKLVKHNPKWQENFKSEAKKIKKIFGKDALKIEHVGSTAIPGILAKPIIDIALVVPSLKKAKRYVKKLKEVGYDLKKNDARTERLFFTKGPEEKRTHYLHIGEIGSNYAEEMILFRDYLRNYKDTAKIYSKLKESLAKKYQDRREIYTAKKEKFVKEIVKKAKKSFKPKQNDKYQPPYNIEELKKFFPDKAEELLKDVVHLWRAKTGIELIHQEPALTEQLRIWKNWNQMISKMKKESDKESIKLFGKNNTARNEEIMKKWKRRGLNILEK